MQASRLKQFVLAGVAVAGLFSSATSNAASPFNYAAYGFFQTLAGDTDVVVV